MVEGVQMLEGDLSDHGIFNGFAEAIDDSVGSDGERVEMRMLMVKTLDKVVPGDGFKTVGIALPGGAFNTEHEFFKTIVFGVLGEGFGDQRDATIDFVGFGGSAGRGGRSQEGAGCAT